MRLKQDLLDLIARGAPAELPDDDFDQLALRVFAHQIEQNPVYRRFCEVRGVTPSTVGGWLDIPAVPTDAFRVVPPVSGDPKSAEVVFRTSGTTGGTQRRGAHYMLDADLYRASLRAGFRATLMPDIDAIRVLSLIPPVALAPDSSLSFMLREVMAEFGTVDSANLVDTSGVDFEAFARAAEKAVRDGVSVLVAGTSFAFVHLFDAMRRDGSTLELPAGSRVMDTGGFKGRSREVTREDLYAMIEERLGVSHSFIINEYGMTEMSSQFYDGVAGAAPPTGEPRRHSGPGWVRTVAVDPETLRPLPAGEAGILRHFDLANLHSLAALQTSDMGRVLDDRIELIGRLPGAAPRGCSIAMDELQEAVRRR